MPWRQQDRLPHGVQISVGFTLQRLLVSLAFTSLFANVLFVLMPEKQDRCEAKLAQARSALSAAKADVESLRSELSSAKRRPCAHARGAEEVEQEDKGEASIEKASDGAHVGTRERGAVSSPATTGDSDEDAPRSYSFAAVGQSASEVLLPGQGIECAKEEQVCECGGGLVWYGHALSHRWAQARAVDVSIKCRCVCVSVCLCVCVSACLCVCVRTAALVHIIGAQRTMMIQRLPAQFGKRCGYLWVETDKEHGSQQRGIWGPCTTRSQSLRVLRAKEHKLLHALLRTGRWREEDRSCSDRGWGEAAAVG